VIGDFLRQRRVKDFAELLLADHGGFDHFHRNLDVVDVLRDRVDAGIVMSAVGMIGHDYTPFTATLPERQ